MKNKIMQLFNDNKERPKFKASAEGDESTVYLYDAIGGWYGVEAKSFVKDLAGVEAETVHLRINSPGGDVFEARAIATALKQMKCKTVAHIDGVCASAATYIALACDEVEMAEGAFFMIHKAWCLAMGNADELLATADLLVKVDDSIVTDYAKKTGLESEEIQQLMADETWFNAEEALDKGFVDNVYQGDDVEASWNLSAYDNAPEKLINKKTVANNQETCYDRAKFERRLALMEG